MKKLKDKARKVLNRFDEAGLPAAASLLETRARLLGRSKRESDPDVATYWSNSDQSESGSLDPPEVSSYIADASASYCSHINQDLAREFNEQLGTSPDRISIDPAQYRLSANMTDNGRIPPEVYTFTGGEPDAAAAETSTSATATTATMHTPVATKLLAGREDSDPQRGHINTFKLSTNPKYEAEIRVRTMEGIKPTPNVRKAVEPRNLLMTPEGSADIPEKGEASNMTAELKQAYFADVNPSTLSPKSKREYLSLN